MRRTMFPTDRAEQPHQADLSDTSATDHTDKTSALVGDAPGQPLQPQRAGAATPETPQGQHARRPAIQVILPSERTAGQSLKLPTLTLGGAAKENNAGQGDEAYDLDLPHETGVYLLAIVREGQHCRYFHARHYVGWAVDIADRVAAHRRGKGARFTQTLVAQGYGLWLVAWFPGDRTAERAIKLTHNAPRFCPLCRAGLCVIDQPPQYACMQEAADAVPVPARFGQQFRQGQLLQLTEALTAPGPAGTAGPGADVTSGGDTVVERPLSRSAGAI